MVNRYAEAGVNVPAANRAIKTIISHVRSTWPMVEPQDFGAVQREIGYFANIVNIGNGLGLAMTTDGVGSKTQVADMMRKYDTIGIDCIAMNVNDLICVGAKPLSLVDYIGVHSVDEKMLDGIGVGLATGAQAAGISIIGGEISQLPDIIHGFDLVGAAVGIVRLDQIIDGSTVEPGDMIIGIRSHGIHSNGLSDARRALINQDWYVPRDELSGLSIGEELLRPTDIYVEPLLDILKFYEIKAFINITGDGLMNLSRVAARNVGFRIYNLPIEPQIFHLIRYRSEADSCHMFEVYNMGVGFCIIVAKGQEDKVVRHLEQYAAGSRGADIHYLNVQIIGTVVEDKYNSVDIEQHKIVGIGKQFSNYGA